LRFRHDNARLLVSLNHFHLIIDPLDGILMKSRWDTLVSVYSISSEQHVVMSLHVHHEKGRRHNFAPNVSSLQIIPFAFVGSPVKPLRLRFVHLRSPSTWPSFLNSDNNKMLTLAPPSMSMCPIGIPFKCPRMKRGFMCAPRFFGF
jgi:hypothetical protein